MKALCIAALLCLILPSSAAAESHEPMRAVSRVVTTLASMNDAQACAVRDIAHNGRAVVVPIERGVEIDQLTITLLTKPTDPRFRVRITDDGTSRKLEAFYRHPYSDKAASARMAGMVKSCAL
jgi:hypothetical protein